MNSIGWPLNPGLLGLVMFRVADSSAMAPKSRSNCRLYGSLPTLLRTPANMQLCQTRTVNTCFTWGLNVTVTLTVNMTVNVLPGSLSMTVTVTVSVTININATADILWDVYVTVTDTGTVNFALTVTLHSCIT